MLPFNVIVIFLWHSRFGRVLMEWIRIVPACNGQGRTQFFFATCLPTQLEKSPVFWKAEQEEIKNVKRLVRIGNISGRLFSEWLPRKAHQVSLIPQIHHKASHHRLQVGEMCSGTKLAQILERCFFCVDFFPWQGFNHLLSKKLMTQVRKHVTIARRSIFAN